MRLQRFWEKKKSLSSHCITLAIICQVLGAFFISHPASAVDTNNFYFKDFTADYYLSRAEDGTSRLRVVEDFTAVFPNFDQNHGITRVIPYTNQGGQNLTMPSDKHLAISVRRNGIAEEPARIEPGDGYFTVYLGDASEYVHGTQRYRLEYEFINVITEFEEDGKAWQELYWDTNGNDWAVRFENVNVRVHLEDAALAAWGNEAWCYVGEYGESGSERCEIRRTGDGAEFRASGLRAGENLTFVFEFAEDSFVIPAKKYNFALLGVFVLELLVGAVAVVLVVKFYFMIRERRHHYKTTFVVPEYQPPKGISVAEAAGCHIGSLPGNGKVATLLELAINKKADLIKQGKKSWAVRVKSLDLTEEQSAVLQILKGKRGLKVGEEIVVKNHTATNTLVELNQKYNNNVTKQLKAKGYIFTDANAPKKHSNQRTAAEKLSNGLAAFAVVWAIAVAVLSIFLSDSLPSYTIAFGANVLWPLVIVLAVTIAVGTLAVALGFDRYATYTKQGLDLSRYLDGLKLYIKMAEKDRLEFLQSVKGADTSHQGIVKLYEKLLPYAVLFKLEKSWLAELGKYYEMQDVKEPNWYIGVGAFSAADFSRSVAAASSAAGSSINYSSSAGSSSGFSGGGGGGFSGGGGGGGGGRGW